MCNVFCILILVLVGLVCAWLGYLWGKAVLKKKIDLLGKKLADCQSASSKTQEELAGLKKRYDVLVKKGTDENAIKAKSVGKDKTSKEDVESSIQFDAVAASAIFGKKVKVNDLKIIEGIGPKIEELFNNAGIKSWKGLSETSVDRLQNILGEGGSRFQMHDPKTWPEQSRLAYEGKFKELKTLQDKLNGGK